MFVLSSRTEGISLTLLEAMACGLPIVATDVGGNGEVVKQGETGELVAVGDARQLATAMLRFWREPIVADRYGRMGRRRIEDHFNVVKMVRSYESIYQEVLDQRSAGHWQLHGVEEC
jgi:glycosyltransferase involved in cell wall biosynthesis